MSRAMKQVMCYAVLGFVAFTLQGCGDTAAMKAHLQQYAATAAAAVQSAATAAVSKSLQAAEGCPPLLASTKEHKGEIVSKVYEKAHIAASCKAGAEALAPTMAPTKVPEKKDAFGQVWTKEPPSRFSEQCMKETAFELADMTMFYAEADPGFKVWMKAHETVWNQVKAVINKALRAEYLAPVKVMYQNEGNCHLGRVQATVAEFKEYFTEEIGIIIDATLKVFCPTSDEAVKKSMEKDNPLVEAAAATAKAKAVLSEAKLEEEVLDEKAAAAAAKVGDAGPPIGRRLVASEDIQI